MPKFIIEREIPGAGQLTGAQLEAIIQNFKSEVDKIGPLIHWEQSYLTNDKIYCIYSATDKKMISDHSRAIGIPANNISEIIEVMDESSHPSTHAHELWYYE